MTKSLLILSAFIFIVELTSRSMNTGHSIGFVYKIQTLSNNENSVSGSKILTSDSTLAIINLISTSLPVVGNMVRYTLPQTPIFPF